MLAQCQSEITGLPFLDIPTHIKTEPSKNVKED